MTQYLRKEPQKMRHYSVAHCGLYKAGKSHMMGTYPKPLFIQVDTNRAVGEAQAAEMIDYTGGTPKEVWEDWDRKVLPALYNRDLSVLGITSPIESVCIDSYTFLFEVMQEAVAIPKTKQGEDDTFKWYRKLRELAKQHMYKFMSLATPFPGDSSRPCYNVAIAYHMKAEYRDVANSDKRIMVGYVPAIEGSFKDKIGSYPGTLLWHEKDGPPEKPNYFCYTKNPDKFKQADDSVGGKGGHKTLPPKIENTWDSLMEGWGVGETK